MKKITINNNTYRSLSIVTDETTYRIEANESISVETESKIIYLRNSTAQKAKVMLGLAHDFEDSVNHPWAYELTFMNTHNSYFNVEDVYRFVDITEHCYCLRALGGVVFSIFKVHAAKKEVQKVEFSEKNQKKYNLFRFVSLFPLLAITSFVLLVIVIGLIMDFDIYMFCGFFLFLLFWLFLVHMYKKQKLYLLIGTEPDKLMQKADKVEIFELRKRFVKYRTLE